MNRPKGQRLLIVLTGLVYGLIGIVLAGGGLWLASLGGSLFYLIAGLGILATGALLLADRRSALPIYAIVLIGTLIWAVSEVGFDWWPLAARGDVIFPLGLWLLVPWISRNLGGKTDRGRNVMTWPLWGAVALALVVLAIGLFSDYHDIDGALASNEAEAPVQESSGQPAEDWRAYGGTQAGQRYSP